MKAVFSKTRLEALSDAVFAIVMTLLVLDLKAPTGISPGGLAAALSHESHAWFSFIMTFTIAATFWTLQHHVFDAIRETGRESLVSTFFFLAFITLLPFTTSLIGQQSVDRLAFILYFADLFAAAFSLAMKMEVAHFTSRLHEGVDVHHLRFRLYRISAVMLFAVLSSWLLPLRFFYVGPVVAIVASRVLQKVVWRRIA